MNDMSHHVRTTRDDPTLTRRRWTIAVAMLVLIAGFYLLREHWGHVAGSWPYLLLLVCPLMHLMHGHGRHGHHADRDTPSADARSSSNQG